MIERHGSHVFPFYMFVGFLVLNISVTMEFMMKAFQKFATIIWPTGVISKEEASLVQLFNNFMDDDCEGVCFFMEDKDM